MLLRFVCIQINCMIVAVGRFQMSINEIRFRKIRHRFRIHYRYSIKERERKKKQNYEEYARLFSKLQS